MLLNAHLNATRFSPNLSTSSPPMVDTIRPSTVLLMVRAAGTSVCKPQSKSASPSPLLAILDACFNASWRATVRATTVLATSFSDSSNVSSSPSSSSMASSSLSLSAPPSAILSDLSMASCISLCASRIRTRQYSICLLMAARLSRDIFSNSLMRFSTFPTDVGMSSFTEVAPIPAPKMSRALARLSPNSRSSARREGPANLKVDSNMPTTALKAFAISSPKVFRAAMSEASATDAEAPNLIRQFLMYSATCFTAEESTTLLPLLVSSRLASKSPRASRHTRVAGTRT
mmetsp:Transcript_33234/g.88940  ORF Transcript_33234/g.88940 Transcript_33234/m.88940 type:complete len:288 (-) Transcript_33234:64-927(-)